MLAHQLLRDIRQVQLQLCMRDGVLILCHTDVPCVVIRLVLQNLLGSRSASAPRKDVTVQAPGLLSADHQSMTISASVFIVVHLHEPLTVPHSKPLTTDAACNIVCPVMVATILFPPVYWCMSLQAHIHT